MAVIGPTNTMSDSRESIWQFSHGIERFYRRLRRQRHLQSQTAAAADGAADAGHLSIHRGSVQIRYEITVHENMTGLT